MSSVSASLGEIPEKSAAETSEGREIFGEEGRMMPGTSFVQGEEVGAFVSRSVRMSRMIVSGTSSEWEEEVGAFVSGSVRMSRMNVLGTSSKWGEEISAAAVESAGMLGIVSASRLSCICNPTCAISRRWMVTGSDLAPDGLSLASRCATGWLGMRF